MGVSNTTSILKDKSYQDINSFFFNIMWAAVMIGLDKGQSVVGFIVQKGILFITAGLIIDVYSKAFLGGNNRTTPRWVPRMLY